MFAASCGEYNPKRFKEKHTHQTKLASYKLPAYFLLKEGRKLDTLLNMKIIISLSIPIYLLTGEGSDT